MSSSPSGKNALFAGLCTFDVIQAVARQPGRNEKVTAVDQVMAAGGPATNASVTFAFLGGHATLLTGVGSHPLAEEVRADLRHAGVTLVDAAGTDDRPPPVSAITVSQPAGDRCVVSRNAADRDLRPPPSLGDLVEQADAVLIDGHHPRLAEAAARAARAHGRLCILDGGSWKDITPALLPHVDIAICSADFRPPDLTRSPGLTRPLGLTRPPGLTRPLGVTRPSDLTRPPGITRPPDRPPSAADVLHYLRQHGIRWAAVTDGANPVAWAGPGVRGEIDVPAVRVTDTLAAGDIFHGAFTSAIVAAPGGVTVDSFTRALRFAAKVAARSCETFGTRAWMNSYPR